MTHFVSGSKKRNSGKRLRQPLLPSIALYRAGFSLSAIRHSATPSPIFIYKNSGGGLCTRPIKNYVCPADPGVTWSGLALQWTRSRNKWAAGCYAANVQVFGTVSNPIIGTVSSYQGSSRIPTSFPDGLSQTILFAEKYASCGEGGSLWDEWNLARPYSLWMPLLADSLGRGGVAAGPGALFQVKPTLFACNPALAQTSHNGGIQVSLGDGSVRIVNSGVNGTTWWAAFTPSAGDILGGDW